MTDQVQELKKYHPCIDEQILYASNRILNEMKISDCDVMKIMQLIAFVGDKHYHLGLSH